MLSSNIKSETIPKTDHSKRSKSKTKDLGDILPYDKMAEQAVLGAIIIQNAILPQILDIINTEDFFSPANQSIFSAMQLMASEEPTEELRKELRSWVRKEIGPFASPDLVQWAPGLPKTRSGKIMRRILRKIAEDDFGSLGDTSTLAEPAVVNDLIEHRKNK